MKVYVVVRKQTSFLDMEVVAVTHDRYMADSLIISDAHDRITDDYPVFLGDYEVVEKELDFPTYEDSWKYSWR